MPERNAGSKIHLRMGEDHHKRLGLCGAELDATNQDYVVELLGRELCTGKRPLRTAEPEAGTWGEG